MIDVNLSRVREVLKDVEPNIVEQFIEYHEANPHVFEEFVTASAQMIVAGRSRYSAWAVINQIRWNHDIRTNSADFKINNNFIALYARLAMAEFSCLEGFFETRELISKRKKTNAAA